MKKIFIAISLICGTAPILFLNSCDRVKEAVEDISVPVPFPITMDFTTEIPFATVSTTSFLKYPEITMDIDTDAKIKEKYPKLSIDNLKKATVTALKIDLLSSTLTNDLTAIGGARMYLRAPGLEDKLVAEIYNNTSPSTLVFTTKSDVDIAPYLKSKKNSLILEVQGKKLALDKFNIKITPTFKIEVGL